MAAAAADAATHRRWFEAELAAISELTSDVKRIAALERAAEHTPSALWDDLLALAATTRKEAQRGKAFCQLLPRVPERLLPAVLRAMLSAQRPEVYIGALAAAVSDHMLPILRQCIEHLPEDRRAEGVAALARRAAALKKAGKAAEQMGASITAEFGVPPEIAALRDAPQPFRV